MESMQLEANIRSEGGMLWAEVVELPGCFASGANAGELIEALEEAIGLYLAGDRGEPVSTHVASIGLEVDALQPA